MSSWRVKSERAGTADDFGRKIVVYSGETSNQRQ